MNRFLRLIKNEFVKLFARPLIFILIISIPLLSLGYAFIIKSSGIYYYYSESPESQMQNRINELNAAVLNEHSDSRFVVPGEKYYHMKPDAEFIMNPDVDLEYAMEELEMLQYARSKGYAADSWKINALYEALRYKSLAKESEDSLRYQKAVNDIYAAVENDDLLAYYNVSMDILNLQKPENEIDKAMNEGEKEVLQLRIDKKIPPSPRFMDHAEMDKDWQNQILNTLGHDIYKLKTNRNDQGYSLTEQEKQELEADIAIKTYRIKTDSPPIKPDSLYGFLSTSSMMVSLISLFIIIIAATIMASEYSQGTIKLLLISPYRRWKLFAAKLVTVFITALLLLTVLFVSSIIAGGIAFGFDFSGSFIKYAGGRVIDSPYIVACLLKYLLVCPELLVMTSLSIMLAVVMRRSSVAIGVGVGMMFGGSIITAILYMMPYDFKRFILFLNTNLSVYFPELGTNDYMSIVDVSRIEGMSFTFSIIVLAVYFICFTYIALDSFNRRDVKQA